MIQGRTVALRPVEDGDVPFIHRWMNEPTVWRAMDYERPFSLADIREDVERSRTEGQPFTILVEDRPVGRIGLNGFHRRDRVATLYVYIGEPDCLGKGHGTDAVRTLLGYAFGRFDLARIELWALADNDRALEAYRRCGFVEDARLPERSFKEGAWVDRVVMSVTRQAFAAIVTPVPNGS